VASLNQPVLPFLQDSLRDSSVPCRVAIGRRHPESIGDEPDYRCEELVEDLVAELTTESDRRLSSIVDRAAGLMAERESGIAQGSDDQIEQLDRLFREAGLLDDDVPLPAASRWVESRAWKSPAQASILALLGTLVSDGSATTGVATDLWVKRCEESLDSAAFQRSSAIASSDIHRTLEIAADVANDEVRAVGDLPLVYRGRWVRLAADGEALRVRHFVPGLVELHSETDCTGLLGHTCRDTGTTTAIPIGHKIGVTQRDHTLFVGAISPKGSRLPGIMSWSLADDEVAVAAHQVCFRTEPRPHVVDVEARRGTHATLWEWDATQHVAFGDPCGAMQSEDLTEAVDRELSSLFVQPD
jgi:hypothetical protein